MKKKAYFFDIDGTILDSMDFWNKLNLNYIKTKTGKEVTEALNKQLETFTFEEAVSYIKNNYLPAMQEKQISAEIYAEIRRYFRDEVKLKLGFLDFLKKISDAKCYLFTLNEKEIVSPAFQRLGIEKYFSDIFTSSEIGISKNKKEFYLKIIKDLAYQKEEVIFFEDSDFAINAIAEAGYEVIKIKNNWINL